MPNPSSSTEMQTYLINLDLSRIALCNAGANTRADILLTKRKETTQMPDFKTFEDVAKSFEAPVLALVTKHIADTVTAKTVSITEELNTAKATIATLTEDKATLTAELTALKSAEPTSEEALLKSVSPEVAAIFKKQQETIAGLIEKEQAAIAEERFVATKSIPVPEADLKAVLKSASPAVLAVLTAAAKAIDAAVIDEPTGTDGAGTFKTGSADEAYTALEEAAKAEMTKSANTTFEAAFSAACTQNPALYAAYTKGV